MLLNSVHPTPALLLPINQRISTGDDGDAGPAEEDIDEYEEDSLETVEKLSRKPIETGDWKDQDHYALLGLSNLRVQASADAIDKQYKRMTIRHHPDKKSTAASTDADRAQADAYFTCVRLAYGVLSNPHKRLLYDSIDIAENADAVPAITKDEAKFYKRFGPAFKRNIKWILPKGSDQAHTVPTLGNAETPKEEVDSFYEYWYATESWRKFGYFDKENPDNADSREEKRYLQQKNKAERKRKDTEEKKRMLTLIDNAFKSDPRRLKFKADGKKAKLDAAKEKEEAKAAAKQAKLDAAEAAAAAEAELLTAAKDANASARGARKTFGKKCKKLGVHQVGDS
jgi:DnaJ family protein C protein 2